MNLARWIPTGLVALALTLASFAGCGITAGHAIAVTFFARGAAADFDTAAGFRVHLTDAHIALGPIYVMAPTRTTTRLERLRALSLPIAYAHGGHDDDAALAVRAEWLDFAVVDLLDPSGTVLGEGDGTAGLAELTTVELATPTDASGPTHGHVAWVAGTATPIGSGAPIAFEGGLDLPSDALSRSVESIASSFAMDRGGRFELVLHVEGRGAEGPSWLEQAHFDRLPAPTGGGVRVLVPGTQPYTAWYLAARDADAFTTSYAPVTP